MLRGGKPQGAWGVGRASPGWWRSAWSILAGGATWNQGPSEKHPPMRILCHTLNRLGTRYGTRLGPSAPICGRGLRVDTGSDGSRQDARRGFRLAVESAFGYLNGPGIGSLPMSSRPSARRSAFKWVPCIQFTLSVVSSPRAPLGSVRDPNQDLLA